MATIIFKPTESCNARCAYCEVVRKKPRSPSQMPLHILETLFVRINEFLLDRPEEHIDLVWHGGEPLLLGPEYLAHALDFQQTHCPETQGRIHHSLQSNLTLFTREFSPILKKLGIKSIGTSYDPIENIRGLGTKRDWETYNRRFLDAICLLEEEGFCWGIIYVVTKLSLAKPRGVFQFLCNLAPKGSFMFNPVLLYDMGLKDLRVTPEEYVDFLGAIFPAWWGKRHELTQVEPFASLVRNLVDRNPSLMCSDSGRCAHNYINVLPDGSLSHCGRSADWGLLNYGFIGDRPLSDVLTDPQRDALLQRNTVLPQTDCKGCRFWDICHGGCPLDAWSSSRSFLNKTEWCVVKRGFIEKYLEPVVNAGASTSGPTQKDKRRKPIRSSNEEKPNRNGLSWISPVGGLGDTLMLSGVLKQVVEREPERKFNLVDRTKYRQLLEGHPAIDHIAHPPPWASIVSMNYWDQEAYRNGGRAYQILAGMFGLEPPVEERLYVPWNLEDDPVLMKTIPWKTRNVLICQSSDSPRKQMAVTNWESLIERLKKEEIGVVQTGRLRDRYVRGAYSLLGLTTVRQLISLLRYFDAVVTSDNFLMHAAHLSGVPTVVLWGPTDRRVYGYSEQIHLQATTDCDYPDGCIGPGKGNVYQTDCPRGTAQCVNTLELDTIYNSIASCLNV